MIEKCTLYPIFCNDKRIKHICMQLSCFQVFEEAAVEVLGAVP